jgi:azurin
MKWICTAAFLLISRVSLADVCQLNINATDLMRFEQKTLQIESRCTEVEVTLHHTGTLPANAMGHNWVLVKTADIASVASAGMTAGLEHNYQQPGDTRIVAATKVIGGGESTTVKFSTALLDAGESYSYFCSSPGHYALMKGSFVLNSVNSSAVAKNDSK